MTIIFYKAEQGDQIFRGIVELDEVTNQTVQNAVSAKYTTATNVVHYHEQGVDCDCGEW